MIRKSRQRGHGAMVLTSGWWEHEDGRYGEMPSSSHTLPGKVRSCFWHCHWWGYPSRETRIPGQYQHERQTLQARAAPHSYLGEQGSLFSLFKQIIKSWTHARFLYFFQLFVFQLYLSLLHIQAKPETTCILQHKTSVHHLLVKSCLFTNLWL